MLLYDHFSIEEATALQLVLQKQIVLKPLDKSIKTVGGADISFNTGSNMLYAGIVVLDYPEMTVRSYSLFAHKTTDAFHT